MKAVVEDPLSRNEAARIRVGIATAIRWVNAFEETSRTTASLFGRSSNAGRSSCSTMAGCTRLHLHQCLTSRNRPQLKHGASIREILFAGNPDSGENHLLLIGTAVVEPRRTGPSAIGVKLEFVIRPAIGFEHGTRDEVGVVPSLNKLAGVPPSRLPR